MDTIDFYHTHSIPCLQLPQRPNPKTSPPQLQSCLYFPITEMGALRFQYGECCSLTSVSGAASFRPASRLSISVNWNLFPSGKPPPEQETHWS